MHINFKIIIKWINELYISYNYIDNKKNLHKNIQVYSYSANFLNIKIYCFFTSQGRKLIRNYLDVYPIIIFLSKPLLTNYQMLRYYLWQWPWPLCHAATNCLILLSHLWELILSSSILKNELLQLIVEILLTTANLFEGASNVGVKLIEMRLCRRHCLVNVFPMLANLV